MRFYFVVGLIMVVGGRSMAQSVIRAHDSEFYAGGLGNNVAAIGDVDKDGVPDYAGQSMNAEMYGYPPVTIFSGKTGKILSHVMLPVALPYQFEFGTAMDGCADVDGDGNMDIIIGSPQGSLNSFGGFSGKGGVYIVRALDGAIIRTHVAVGSTAPDGFGIAVRFLGDLNGDGRSEYAGSTLSGSIVYPGHAYVYDGASGSLLGSVTNGILNSAFGVSLSRVPDITGDGRDEFAVGDFVASVPGKSSCGIIYVYTYSAGTFSLINTITGDIPGANIGFAAAVLDDIDGDGGPEIVTGHHADAAIYNLLTGSLVRVIHGYLSAFPIARRLQATDDLDGDGHRDFLTTEWVLFVGPPYYAKAVAFSSGTGNRLYEYENEKISNGTTVSTFPDAIAVLGDVDGDQISDWAVGIRNYVSSSNPNGGTIRVLSIRSLYSQDTEISPSAGSTVAMDLNAGLVNAGRNYFILSSYTGTSGIHIGPAIVPLTYDALTEIGIYYANTPVFSGFSGVLDSNGNAHAQFDGTLIPPAAQGLTFSFAYILYGGTGPFVASNAHQVAIHILGP